MPKSYNDVHDEYQQFKSIHPDDPTDLPSFAKQMDAAQGVSDRTEAYDAGMFKQANAAIDRAFDYSPAPDLIASPRDTGGAIGEALGSGFDKLTGTHITPTLKSLGEETPRMVGEGLLTAVQPEAAPVILGERMSMLARLIGGVERANNVRTASKIAGYGSAFTRGTAEADGNPIGGAISAGSLGLGNYAIPKAGEAVEQGLTKLLERGTADYVPGETLAAAPELIRRGLGGVANAVGGVAAATGINEATRQAALTVAPEESRTEGDRNPFTQENIAGNVAGAAFFAPQILGSVMHGGPRVSPKQVEQLGEHLKAQESGAVAQASPEVVPGGRQEALFNILEQSIENRKAYQADGRTEEVGRLDQTIEDTYNEIVSGRFSPVDEANKERLKASVEDTVKFQPPDTPEKFSDLASQIKSNLDFLNEGRVRYESELAQREAELNPNDKKAVSEFNAWKAEQARRGTGQAGAEQTWHPQARASQVVDRLWKSGDLPPLSEQWLKSEWNATFDESGNPQFSNQVLAQKMSNYFADRLNASVKAESLNRKAVTPPSEYTGSKVDASEKQFIESLHKLPKEILRDVLNRTVAIRSSERVDNRTGQSVSQMKEWQRAVIRAAESYKSEEGTILVSYTGKAGEGPVFKKVPITRLVEKVGNGYAWTPSERRVSVSEGGKPAITNDKGQQVAEGNIEALKKPSGEQIDIGDEEAFKRALAEQSDMPFGDRTDLALDKSNTLETPNVDMLDEAGQTGESNISEKISGKQDAFKKNLASLSDDELWRLAEPHFKVRTSDQRVAKQKQLRLALNAALDTMKAGKGNLGEAGKKFLAERRAEGVTTTKGKGDVEDAKMLLRSFFQTSRLDEGASAELIRKLTDGNTIKRVKSGNVKSQYGVSNYWLSPDGTLIPVEHHMDLHEKVLGKKTRTEDDYDNHNTEMQSRGWVRVIDDARDRFVEGKLNSKQRSVLELDAIEHERTLTHDTGKILYQPPKAQSSSERVTYERLQQQMSALGHDKIGTPEYNKLWQASEDIKNRNEGMPPGETAGEERPDQGTLANVPPQGRFVEDVTRTLRTRIDTLLGRAGYSGTTKTFYTELAVALAKQGALPNLDFYRVGSSQYGLASGEYNGRANLGLNVDFNVAKGQEAKATLQLLQTLGHEIGHLDGYIRDGLIAKPDAYSQERERLKKNFESLGASLTEDERSAMLTVIQEYVPEPLRTNIKQSDGRPYGTTSPDEFSQQIEGYAMKILAHETPAGKAAAADMISYLPTEVRELYRNTFRTVKDVMESMRDAAEMSPKRTEASVLTGDTDPFILSRGFETLLDTARNMSTLRYADKAMADARTWVTNFDKAPQTGMTNSVWFNKTAMPAQVRAQESFPHEPTHTAVEAVSRADEYLNGPRAIDKSKQLGLMGRFLAPFRAEMWAMERNGNKMARPVADAIFGLEPGSHRILANLLQDFMKRGTDGSVSFDAENPLLRRTSTERVGPWRDAVNKVSKWQQETHELTNPQGPTKLDAQSLFVQDKNGELVANPQVKGASEFWEKTRAGLSKEDQQFVASQSFALDRLGERARDILTTSIAESNVNRATALVMATNKNMDFGTASGIAKAAHDAYLSGNVLSLRGTIPGPQLEMLGRLFVGPDGKSGLIKNYLDVVQHFENRPGYRSESLPHDWIVRYKNRAGETKFDSRPEEGQAHALARNLQSRGYVIDGEVINKRDANRFSAADDPDGVLTKVTERENFVWGKFVEEMTQKHGTELGASLQSGYTPLEATMRDVGNAGVGKFLKERKGFVDRDSFDYIDSSMANAERLSYAVAVRSMKQRVELLLNDPSVRLQTSFRNLVQGHMQEMLRPQSQTLKELKGITSGMFIAGNLSSTIVNAMQSMQTLVPVLDLMNGDKGNFIKPWKQLGKAIADTTDFSLSHNWKDLAAQTKGIDPLKWSEDQTLAELWRRHVEAGGFTHTVADSLSYSQDQRLLTNAKFGRGDYGPVTKASMLRSGIYLGNQFAMLPFRTVERMNSKVAFLAGARQAYESGLRGDAAYAKAAQVQGLATFGGGRANATGLQTALSKGFTPGGAGLALALQQYAFGVVALHGQFVRDALGQSKALSPAEVWHARRAYGTFLMTQTALAGVLGLPLVGATLTALEKVFGIPANQAVRQGLASLGSDDETGATIAEIGLNGLPDYWTGLDVSSRLGTSSLLGTSSYRGFNWGDLAGPVGSLLEQGVQSLGYFGQGEPMKAATSLAPNFLKKSLEMTDSKAKYGDNGFRDKAGNLLYMPTDTQAAAYKLGFRPRELSRRRQLQSALATSDELTTARRDRELDIAAQSALKGDMTDAQSLGNSAMDGDPLHGSQNALRAIMDRALGATTEKDFLATGSKYNGEERSRIYKTFGPDVQHRQSETALQDLRMQLAAQLGDPRIAPNASSYKQAAVIDSLVANGSMPRSEAVQIVQMLGL